MLERLLRNHVLANLVFVLILVMGVAAYLLLPREQDPTINFNWIQITTVYPGAAAEDIEKLVTDPLEDALAQISDIRFISSTSRDNLSSILVRFNELDEKTFDKRVTDLRREIQNKANDELPSEAEQPRIFEINSSNAFPSATVLVVGPAFDENLRKQARNVKRDLERLKGVYQVQAMSLLEPELQVNFIPERLEGMGVTAVDVANTVAANFRDTSAGTVRLGDQEWLVRVLGTDSEPSYLAQIPISTAQGEVPLGAVAEVERGREEPDRLVSFNGRPAVMLSIMKQGNANMLELVEQIRGYIDRYNELSQVRGVEMVLADDQTVVTREALSVMQRNALLGLALVLFVTWLFLGSRIALLTSIGIPFTLAGTFWALSAMDQTLNVTVLLGVVIVLGMLVDDAVVVVESIYYRLVRGMEPLQAGIESLREVFAPVTASVLTTMAAFSPLMLMPGILGKFMFVVPLVVTTALAISLLEAYWMLPAHVAAFKVRFDKPGRIQVLRERVNHQIRIQYTLILVKVLRWPKSALTLVFVLFLGALGAVGSGLIRMEFFAFDPVRLYYINIEMPAGTAIDKTLNTVQTIEERVRSRIEPHELRAIVSYAGIRFTETEPLFGDHNGQILVSLNPRRNGMREVDEVIEATRPVLNEIPGPRHVSYLRIAGGPPVTRPISVKIRGTDFPQIRAAVEDMKAILATMPAVRDVVTDDTPGSSVLNLRLDTDAVRRAGLNPADVARIVRLLVDGEVVATLQDAGEKVNVRVRARDDAQLDIENILRQSVALPGGGITLLGNLVNHEAAIAKGSIRHYNFKRTITVEADLDKLQIDTKQANERIMAEWEKIRARHPSIDLDFTGELDDIQESLDSIFVLFLFGVGLIYAILGTQFKSYFQPLMILASVPMAFTGVAIGLVITGNPLSLFTLYGVVALAGIAVNAAIVLISAANARLEAGMSVLHATIYAARRRVIPILITALTTVAGLFSLATGLGGKSLMWGPVATSIVWGLAFSTVLTLFVVPLLFRLFMRPTAAAKRRHETLSAPVTE
ncbi:MAG: AcrB/AcrD/AcrF family protein [Proteobacteria bacterium]|nr:MAG: AcrB/AcrD/AcrF family protein [Pseudomonadota bacterium]QKK11111.1 MAG: efflux RND transporter permease subunit [Pseudomonadota bacterium]